MTTAAPLRVLVVGSSVTYMVVPERTSPGQGAYPHLVRDALSARGIPAAVSLRSRWYGRVDEFLRGFEAGIRDPLPDVVVLDVGVVECQARVVPNGLVRHFLTWDRTSHPVARAYRRLLAGRLWRVLRAWQRVASRHAPLWLSRLAPGRFRRDTMKLIELVRSETGAAVVVLGIDTPGARLRHWLPGIAERVAHYDGLLEEVVRAVDDDGVTFLAKRTDADPVPVDDLLPDGLHRTADGHRLLADRLAAVVAEVAVHAHTGRATAAPTAREATS